MKFLFIFLDGIGLGANDPQTNPFVKHPMPNLAALLGGNPLVAESAPFIGKRATLLGLDASMGVSGLPQSASGQASLVTGRNVPAEIGEHFGPKPNPAIAEILQNGSIFRTLKEAGKKAALINAYPQGYFDAIESGRRMYSAIPMAVTNAGIALKTQEDYYNGTAMAADFTGQGWRTHLKREDAPVFAGKGAGVELHRQMQGYDFLFFEFWVSDYIGHKQNWEDAGPMIAMLDDVFGGLFESWDDESGLIFVTSDHGNMEDLSTRRHTDVDVPGLVVGSPSLREKFADGLTDLAGVTPAILRMFEEG